MSRRSPRSGSRPTASSSNGRGRSAADHGNVRGPRRCAGGLVRCRRSRRGQGRGPGARARGPVARPRRSSPFGQIHATRSRVGTGRRGRNRPTLDSRCCEPRVLTRDRLAFARLDLADLRPPGAQLTETADMRLDSAAGSVAAVTAPSRPMRLGRRRRPLPWRPRSARAGSSGARRAGAHRAGARRAGARRAGAHDSLLIPLRPPESQQGDRTPDRRHDQH